MIQEERMVNTMGKRAAQSLLSEETKSIKRANFRIKSVAKKYGIDSLVYQDMVQEWMNEEMKKFVNIGDDGVIQISTKFPKQYDHGDKQLIMSRIERTRGLKDIIESARKFYEISDEEWKKMKKGEKEKLSLNMSKLTTELENMTKELYDAFGHDRQFLEPLFPELFEDNDGQMKSDRMREIVDLGLKLINDKDKHVLSEEKQYKTKRGNKIIDPLKRR